MLILLVLTTPLWFPWALRPAAKRFGATFQKYERVGYWEFAVTGAVYSNGNVRVEAGRLVVAPLRHHARAEDWSVIVTASNRPSTAAPASVHRTYNQVWKIVTNVQQRIAQAALTNGYVQTPDVRVDIPGASLNGSNFSGQAQIANALPLTVVQAKIPPSGPVQIDLSNSSLELETSLVVTNAVDGIFIAATNHWGTNRFSAIAKFGTNGPLPEIARLDAREAVFPPVKGDVAFLWEHNRYVLDARGAALEKPISFAAHLNGGMTSARLESAELITPWASATLEADINFSRSNIAHHGSAVVALNRLDVALEWSGKEFDLTNIHATARADSGTISASGAANLMKKQFQMTGLVLGTNEVEFAAEVHWPDLGYVCAQLTNFSPHVLSGFLNLPEQEVLLEHLRLNAGWTNGPVAGNLDFAGRTTLEDGTRVGMEGALAVHASGLTLTNLTLTRNAEPVSSAHGFLPISINATNKPYITPITNGPLRLQVNVDPKAFVWSILQTNLGISLRGPEVRGEVSGTWNKPTGRIQARAAEMKFRNAPRGVPPIDSLALVAHVREQAVEIEFLDFFITNQPVTFSALMPLPANFWNAPRTNLAKLDWRDLSCRLKIDDAQIAAFVPLFRGLIAPQGIVRADVGLVPGGKLAGQLRIDGAGTRPIESLGALQDIEILCRFSGDKAQVNSFVALGGYSVLGGGQVHLDPNRFLRRELPPWEFHLTGENVPLTRQGDAIVRADLDVTVTHATNQPVTVAGNLNLRDSLYLRELRDLIPGKLASPDRRPPYFAIGAQPFADWRLDLRAVGHRFLKVRTPVFNGVVSAGVKMSGTLGDPIAVGDLVINSGLVRFPFGNISVKQGIVSLTSDNPYRPQVLITGNDRVLGYDINMELTGYADAPVLQFSSTPPLNSDQVLMMLTAGEIPRQGQISLTTQERAQRVALFLGRGMLSDLGVVGDSNRLTLRSGENVSETGRPTYSVEYELTRDWSVIGQYDQFNDFNLMLKWRIFSR